MNISVQNRHRFKDTAPGINAFAVLRVLVSARHSAGRLGLGLELGLGLGLAAPFGMAGPRNGGPGSLLNCICIDLCLAKLHAFRCYLAVHYFISVS